MHSTLLYTLDGITVSAGLSHDVGCLRVVPSPLFILAPMIVSSVAFLGILISLSVLYFTSSLFLCLASSFINPTS